MVHERWLLDTPPPQSRLIKVDVYLKDIFLCSGMKIFLSRCLSNINFFPKNVISGISKNWTIFSYNMDCYGKYISFLNLCFWSRTFSPKWHLLGGRLHYKWYATLDIGWEFRILTWILTEIIFSQQSYFLSFPLDFTKALFLSFM